MKKTLTLLALTLFVTVLLGEVTSGIARIDITPVDVKAPKVKIESPVSANGGSIAPINWLGKEVAPCAKVFNSATIGKEKQSCEISFIPSETGKVVLSFRANDYRNKDGKREFLWMQISNIKVDGAVLPNANLAVKNNKLTSWQLLKGASLVKDAQVPTLRVSLAGYAKNVLQVEKGKKVTISFDVAFDSHTPLK